VEFKEDGKHYSLGLPREFRDIGTLPKSAETAAIVISGEIIEIWRADKLEAHAREVRGKLLDLIERALSDFVRRG
jgi:UDP-2,3-diacylglucosamine pyrophosphatase LpxH